MTIDFATGFYFHREGRGLLFGTNDVCDTQDEWLERAAPVLRTRAPLLLDAPIAGRLVGRLRDDPGPQRADRRAAGRAGPLPVRDRLLRARLPAGARRGRDRARPLPAAASRSST